MGRIFYEESDESSVRCKCCGHSLSRSAFGLYTTKYKDVTLCTRVMNVIVDESRTYGMMYINDIFDHDSVYQTQNTFETYRLYCKICNVFVGWKYDSVFLLFIV